MKLAIFVDHFPVASQTFVLNQITGLIDLGVDVSVVSLNPSAQALAGYDHLQTYKLEKRIVYLTPLVTMPNSKAIIFSRICSTVAGMFRSASSRRTFKALRLWRYGHQAKSLLLPSIAGHVKQPLCFDVILCHFGFNGVLAYKLRDIGVIKGEIATIFHGYEISAKLALQRYHQEYQALFAHTALMLPVNERWQQSLLELGCPQEKIKVQRMGVELDQFKFQASRQIGSCLQLFTVARFAEKKGLEYGLRALAQLADTMEFHYKLAGFGELSESLVLLVKELKLEHKVTFLGPLDQRQVIEQMQQADIFLQPSITAKNGDMEGVPVAIMEAMAVGVVVVSTLHSGIPEIIVHGQHGLLNPERDVAGLKENISLLQSEPALYAEIRYKARARVEEMANVHQLNQQLLLRLQQLVS